MTQSNAAQAEEIASSAAVMASEATGLGECGTDLERFAGVTSEAVCRDPNEETPMIQELARTKRVRVLQAVD